MYNYVEVKKQKGSRVNKEGCKGREVKKLMKMQHMVHLISSNILKLKTPQVIKRKSRLKKAIPLQSISENGSDKLPTIGASVKAKYDGQ